jgi:hypothetical protein
MSNDSLTLFYTIFYYLVYVEKWSPTTFLVLKIKQSGGPPYHIIKVVKSYIKK